MVLDLLMPVSMLCSIQSVRPFLFTSFCKTGFKWKAICLTSSESMISCTSALYVSTAWAPQSALDSKFWNVVGLAWSRFNLRNAECSRSVLFSEWNPEWSLCSIYSALGPSPYFIAPLCGVARHWFYDSQAQAFLIKPRTKVLPFICSIIPVKNCPWSFFGLLEMGSMCVVISYLYFLRFQQFGHHFHQWYSATLFRNVTRVFVRCPIEQGNQKFKKKFRMTS